jgi:two-component system, NtrC family, response regulator AtoC
VEHNTLPATLIETARILLVSRESSLSRSLQALVAGQGWQMDQAFSGLEALERVQAADSADVVLLDLPPGDGEALHTLRWMRRVSPDIPIVLVSQQRNTKEVSDAVQLGARGCLIKPVAPREFEAVIMQHLEKSSDGTSLRVAEEHIDFIADDCAFVWASPVMQKLRTQAEMLAKLDVPVLIRGESGSGKEVVARLIHKLSGRAESKFNEINCAAFPGDTLESELFGYDRGVNGAARSKHGKLELCDEGTIFLDEIEQLPASAQAKLLQLLQQKQFYRVGGKTPIKTNVRVLAASNGGFDRALAERRLREDLYYCLSAFTLHIPSLRQRTDEIPVLLDHFMHRMAKEYGLQPQSFSAELLEACQEYSWPGNLRELENFVKRYLVMGDASLTLEEGQEKPESPKQVFGVPFPGESENVTPIDVGSLKTLMRNIKGEAERNAIAIALEKTNWNRRAAARQLRISYRGLLYKIQQYQLLPPTTHPSALPNSVGSKRNGHGQ